MRSLKLNLNLVCQRLNRVYGKRRNLTKCNNNNPNIWSDGIIDINDIVIVYRKTYDDNLISRKVYVSNDTPSFVKIPPAKISKSTPFFVRF